MSKRLATFPEMMGDYPSAFEVCLTIDRATLHAEKVGGILSDKEFSQILAKKRASLMTLARKVAKGEALSQRESIDAALTISSLAECLSEKPSRARGQSPKIPAWHVALIVEVGKRRGMSRNMVIERMAEEHEVSVEAIRKAVRKHGKDVAKYVDDDPALSKIVES